MPVGSLRAARRLCELSGWTVSNLELHKLLYIAHMFFLGRGSGPLIADAFEAWDYGPVLPNLYHRAKAFGSNPVRNIFHDIDPLPNAPESALLEETYLALKGAKPSKLVAITHWNNGAWAKNYVPGAHHIVIPNEDILNEYRQRAAAKQ